MRQMSDSFVENAKSQQNVLERLVKGLPGISGYVDKELRRNADYRVRQLIGDELDRSRTALLDIQNKLLKHGGLAFMDEMGAAVNKVQLLADKVKIASYGYTGFFDAAKIREDSLHNLRRFDVALLNEVAKLESAVAALSNSMSDKAAIEPLLNKVVECAADLTALFERRQQAIISPDLLTSDFAPEVDLPPAPDSPGIAG
jgi:hypothetical protein